MTKLHSHLKKGFISILSLILIFSSLNVYALDDTSNIIIEDNNLDDESTLQYGDKNEENTFIKENENSIYYDTNYLSNAYISPTIDENNYNTNQEDEISLMNNDNDENNIAITSLDEKNIAAQSNNTTTIDVTGLASGSETSHNCNKYLITKYDDKQHWQQCSICGKVIGNKSNHSFKTYYTMGDSCHIDNRKVQSCDCGYSITSKSGIRVRFG